jgi:hypothetical protein
VCVPAFYNSLVCGLYSVHSRDTIVSNYYFASQELVIYVKGKVVPVLN